MSTHAHPSRLKIITAFAAIYVIWGSTYLGIRFAIETIPPFFMAGMRFVLAGALLYPLARSRGATRPAWRHWRSTIIIGGLLLLGGNGGVTWAEQLVPSGVTALLVATVPLWIVILDWLRPGGVRPAGKVIAGVLLGFLGMALLVNPRELGGAASLNLVGAGAIILATLSWAAGSLYSRQADLPPSPLLATAMEMLAGGGLLFLVSLLTGEWGRLDASQWSLRSLLSLLYLTIFGSIVAFTAYTWLLQVTLPAYVATYAYVNPVVAVFLGWLLANEELNEQTLLAAAIIILSVIIITSYRASRKSAPAVPEPESVVPTGNCS
ncbi:MAG: drug/metabolite exporter YedA [Chloroflexi bacterium]|nr:drug/metabolite exporter YedA [Chloroflexota bacterium]MCI0647592.1 drug/metabolite exporter YedA [Chloroflexota bacterium]MCI0730669.1 drug/metabolite exporter YedA [Chloroflexota bacterium]